MKFFSHLALLLTEILGCRNVARFSLSDKYFLIRLPRFLSSQQIPDKIDTSIRPRSDQDNIFINLFVKLEVFWLGQGLLHHSDASRSHLSDNFRIWANELTLGRDSWLNISMFVLGIFIEQCKPMVRCCAIGLNRLNKCSVYTMLEKHFPFVCDVFLACAVRFVSAVRVIGDGRLGGGRDLTGHSFRKSKFLHGVHCLQCIKSSVPSETRQGYISQDQDELGQL